MHMPQCTLRVDFHTASLSGLAFEFNGTVASQSAAQTILNGMKTFVTNNGGTIDNSSGTFTPDAATLS